MNVAMVANPSALRTVLYSTFGAGFVVLQDLEPVFTFTVLDTVDRATTFNLDDV
ncbi:MAG: hypothetical protein ACI9HK_006283 [Pirellulaceae bacterium]|jgi:hypothetical protein